MMYKLMLLDDEPILLAGLSSQIDWKSYGFELVCTARHGFDGLEKFLDYQPDAILTDIRMRFMNGLDFIREIRQIDSEVEIAVMSAYDVFEYAQKACSLGVTDYLLKPIRDDKLAAVLNTMHQRIEKRRSIASRLEQMESYHVKQHNALQTLAQKKMLLGNCKAETLVYANLPELQPGERVHLVMIADNEEQDNHLLSIPIENMFAEYAAERVLMHCVFDNGVICAALRTSAAERAAEVQMINRFLDAVRNTTKGNLTVTIGEEVNCWLDISKSYHSAEKQMRLARMMGFLGMVTIPIAEEKNRYPYELEQQLLEQISRPVDGYFQKWIDQFSDWSENHPDQFAFAVRSMFMRALQCFVELGVIGMSECERWNSRLERALSLPKETAIERAAAVFAQLYNDDREESGIAGSYMNDIIDQIQAFVAANLQDSSLNIHAAAEHVHVSAPYLGRLFKRTMNMSFNGYLSEVRLERSKRVLMDENLRIGEVALAVGFESQSYFQVQFKKKYGMTPGDYRSQCAGTKGGTL